MRQLSLLVATTLAFFIMLSVFLMSRTSTLHEPIVPNIQTTPEEASKLDELAMRASGTSLDLIESGVALVQPEVKNPVTPGLTHGHAIMPTLSNETIKYVSLLEFADYRAELGRASWKLFHTILARFPETPTLDEREALKRYIHLFARLYPCGEWYPSTQTELTVVRSIFRGF